MLNFDGGQWVDLFGVVFIIRLMAVLWHFPPLTLAESGMWAATISSFAYSNTQGPKNG